jgi:hypothetical protein
MTVSAVDAHRPHVVRMAELHGLIDRHTLAGHVSGPREADDDPPEKPCENQGDDDADLGPDVGAGMENLTHRLVGILLAARKL